MASIIEIKNLSIGYQASPNAKVVAQSLNACLKEGEMTCLLGANGKGKSTLMKTISGFLSPIKGELMLNGSGIKNLNEKQMAQQIAIVLTEKINVPNASVYELVAYGRSPFTGFMGKLSVKDKQIINQSIEMCGIAHKKHDLLSTLSDGERQKATIAKALAQNTPFILLDEPTAFLDLPARVEIMQLLRQLASEKEKAILMSTHDLDLALQMADKLWLLQQDAICSGSPEDLLLSNAFQNMFSKGGVEFDNKTGMFRVKYQHKGVLPVQGHGFEYVLLRRALSRKGIQLKQQQKPLGIWVKIKNEMSSPYVLMENEQVLGDFDSVEKLVKVILEKVDVNKILVDEILLSSQTS